MSVPVVDKHGNPIGVGDPVRLTRTGRDVVVDRIGVVDRIDDMERRGFGSVCGHVFVVGVDDWSVEAKVPAYVVAGGAACYDLEKSS